MCKLNTEHRACRLGVREAQGGGGGELGNRVKYCQGAIFKRTDIRDNSPYLSDEDKYLFSTTKITKFSGLQPFSLCYLLELLFSLFARLFMAAVRKTQLA